MPGRLRKQDPRISPRSPRRAVNGLLLVALACSGWLSACGARPGPRVVSIGSLEAAQAVEPTGIRRAIISDLRKLEDDYYPLGPRLGLFQIQTRSEWKQLKAHAPELGTCPDLRRGIVLGLISHAGMPIDGTWPIRLQSVRIHEGAGFATASFAGGSFLPDGTTYLETAQYDGLAAVLMVEVNGTRFYPQ